MYNLESRLDLLEGTIELLKLCKTVLFRRDILKNWVEYNPVLKLNEIGLILDKEGDIDSLLYVKGDGISRFSELTIKIK